MATDLFPNAQIASWSFLEELSSRQSCPKCQKSRKYFCYTCYVPVPQIKEKLPHVKLPVKVDIIKHPSEIDGKSTSTHAALLAPDDVTIYTYPQIPDYDGQKVVLVFPGKDAITLDDFVKNHSTSYKEETMNNEASIHKREESISIDDDTKKMPNEIDNDSTKDLASQGSNSTIVTHDAKKRPLPSSSEERPEKLMKMKVAKIELPFKKVIFIDSTWNQTINIINDERLKGISRVELKSRDTHFWRKQQGIPSTYMSTIEAIYYFIKDLHTTFIGSYNHEYDNLLLFFCFMYNKIVVNGSGSKNGNSSKSERLN